MNGFYVLDANVFIDAKRRYYAFDLVPIFWDSLIVQAGNGKIRSIDRVKDELRRGNDDLATWVGTHAHSLYMSTDEEDIIQSYTEILNWTMAQTRFTDPAKATFAGCADGWLIAYAKAKGGTVVTHEQPAPNAINSIKIPDVCIAFNVPFLNPFEMLRQLGVRYG